MFHKALKLRLKEKTNLEVTFSTGEVKKYDVSVLYEKYPQLMALNDRKLFTAGRLMGSYGIVWNDELDLETETVYEEGTLVRKVKMPENTDIGDCVLRARATTGLSQKELSAITGIDQADISKIERGLANPSVNTLKRIADGLGMRFHAEFVVK